VTLTEKLVLDFLGNPNLDLAMKVMERLVGRDALDKWLDSPHEMLNNRTPKSLIDEGYGNIIVGLISDIITGMPS
jgi:uncharacterized protein (DUF2384 family)